MIMMDASDLGPVDKIIACISLDGCVYRIVRTMLTTSIILSTSSVFFEL
jgi:hypothetical protein